MATLIQQYAIAQSTELLARATVGLSRIGNDVSNEDGTQQTPGRRAKRQALADEVRRNALGLRDFIARLVAADGVVQAACTFTGANENTAADTSAVTDQRILDVISANWDFIAGVLASEM
jgi:hypothetical protein